MAPTTRPSLLLALLLAACPGSNSADTDSDTADTTGEATPIELDAAGCVPQCVRDRDPATLKKIEVDCTVCDYHAGDDTCEAMVECDEVLGYLELPQGETECFAPRTDQTSQTPSPLDDMSQACIDRGSNAEIFVLRSGDPPAGTVLAVSCAWSEDPAADCPDLTPG